MIKKLLGRSEYIKNSMTLIVGIGLAQVIPVLLQPILRRMFTPEEFGVFAVYFSIVSTLAMIANFKYAQVVVIPEEDKTSLNLLTGAIILTGLFAVLVMLVTLLIGDQIITLTGLPEDLKKWLPLVPLGVLFVSTSAVLNGWLTRKKYYKGIAANKLVRRGAEGAAHISFGSIKLPGGVILGSLVGDMLNTVVSFFQFKRSGGHFKTVNRTGIRDALVRYKEFPLYNLIPSILDTASLFLPVMIISSYYTDEITGQFDLSRQILALPLALISVALSQVLLQNLSEKSKNRKRIAPIIIKNTLALAGVGAVGILILFPFSTPIFEFVFGEKWTLAGELTSILIFSYALKFAIVPVSIIFVAVEKIKIQSIWQIMYFGSICVLLSFKGLELKDFIFYYVIIEVIIYIVYFLLILRTALKHDKFLTS